MVQSERDVNDVKLHTQQPRRPVRVVQVVSNLEFGGAQRQIVELSKHLDPGLFEMHVCSLSVYVPLAEQWPDAAQRLHVIQKRFKYDATVVPRLARLLKRLRADIVHSYLFDANIAARLAGRMAGVAVIINSERNTNYISKKRQLLAYRMTRRCVDLIIANSRAGAAYNRQKLHHLESQYRVVHNGVDVERFRPQDPTTIRASLGVAPRDKIVGMFASFKAQKNHPLLIAAAERVQQQLPDVRWLFVGDELHGGLHGSDDYKQNISRLIEDAGLRNSCMFLGNRQDVEKLYSACDVTVLPSLYEGTPNAALESMACGVPVVVTDVADNAYVVPDRHAGYVVPRDRPAALAERLVKILSNADHRRDLGTRARAWVMDEFSVAKLAERTAAIYEDQVGAGAWRPDAAPKRVRHATQHG